MPNLTEKFPKLRRHQRGQAFVEVDGVRRYLGPFDDPSTRERYDRFIAEWLANGRCLPPEVNDIGKPNLVTVAALACQFVESRRNQCSRSEWVTIRAAVRVLVRLYGSIPAAEFGPKALRTVRTSMVVGDPDQVRTEKDEHGNVVEVPCPRCPWSRKHINKQISRIRTVFRWAVAQELVPESVYRRLQALEALRRGEQGVRDRDRVKPVPKASIRLVRRYLPCQIRALIDLQLLTAARPGELVGLRATEIDQMGDVWTFQPEDHKTAHHDKERVIYFGPRAQQILLLFMRPDRNLDAPLFSPREANAQVKAQNTSGHRRKDQKPNPTKTTRRIGDQYTTDTYRRAIHRACGKSGIPVWGPHQLRHNAATMIRRQFGIELAQIILGHASANVTAIYAEKQHSKAKAAIKMVG